jgi:hypothetical protein
MKKRYDWLSIESSKAAHCLEKITTFWELNFPPLHIQKPAVQLYSLAFLTLFLHAYVPFGQNEQLHQSAGAESCAEHTFLSEGAPVGTISLPKFDPALGTLRSVEMTTECTVMADVEEKKVQGNNYSLGLSITLTTGLPNQNESVLHCQSQFRKALRADHTAAGFTANFSETKKSTELITDQLAAFSGKGEVAIPLQVQGLINFRNETSRISSHLKTKLCIKYHYD